MNSLSAPISQHWHADLRLAFALDGERTVLRENRHRGPLRVQKALYPEGDGVCQVIVLHPPSGIAGGDHLHVRLAVDRQAHAQITTPGAGKWYRSAGEDASQCLELSVDDGALLEWLPQESIVFDGARARMETRVSLTGSARFLGWDILCLGRTAAGERFTHGRFDVLYRVDRDAQPVWLERGGFDGGDDMLHSPAAWAGATVCGSLLLAVPGLSRQSAEVLAQCRAVVPSDQAMHALTMLPDLLIARYLGDNSEAARGWFAALWQILRPLCCGRPALAPRIWNT